MAEPRATPAAIRDAVGGLWPVGLALVQLRVVVRWFGGRGEAHEWAQYLLLGLLFLGALSLQWLAGRLLGHRIRAVGAMARLVLGGAGIAIASAYLLDNARPAILGLAAVNGALLLLFAWVGARRGSTRGPGATDPLTPTATAAAALLGIVLVAASWAASVRMIWWTDPVAWVSSSTRAASVLAVALVLVSANLAALRRPTGRRRPRLEGAGTLAGLAVIGLSSVRLDTLGAGAPDHPLHAQGMMAFHHWGAIVGGAELVRGGGWLLWDAPSQYGFLNALTVAWMPAESAWQAFYLVNALLLATAAGILFLMLRALRSGPLNLPFALGVALASVFMIPGWTDAASPAGPQVTPAVGPFRFFWCFGLLAVLALECRASPRPDAYRTLPILGCVAWLVGTLWSCESGAYCAVIWGPAYLVMIQRRVQIHHPGPGSGRPRVRMFAAWLALPPTLLGAAAGSITLFYLARLGQAPDWRAFADYVVGMGAFALPADPGGIVAALVLAFVALSVLAASLARRGADPGALALALGAWGVLWAGSSYFVGRSHEVNGCNLNALMAAALAAALLIVRSGKPGVGRVVMPVTLAAGPLLIALLTQSFGVDGHIERQVAALRRGYRAHVEHLLPRADPSLDRLMADARVGPDDPVTVASGDLNLLPMRHSAEGRPGPIVHETWLPPFVLLAVLPFDRQEVYLRRFAERGLADGWFAQQKGADHTNVYRDLVLKYHRPVESFENGGWRLSRLEPDAPRR